MSAKDAKMWMPFYWGSYLKNTMHLRADGHGAYFLLLGACWMGDGSVPDDDDQLAAIARCDAKQWQRLRPTLAKLFQIGGGVWRQERLSYELERSKRLADAKQESGRRGGEAKAAAVANARRTPTPTPLPLPASGEIESPESEFRAREADEPASKIRSQGVAGSGSGPTISTDAKWREQAGRDDYAQTEIVKRLVPPRGIEPWTVMAMAEDPASPDHDSAVTLVLAAAKAAGVGWISPAERKRRGRPGHAAAPAELTDIPGFLRRSRA